MHIPLSTGIIETYIDGSRDAPYLLLCLPGFLDHGNYAHLAAHRAYFAQHDYLAVSLNPPGVFGSTGTYLISTYLQTVNELINYFGNKPTFVLGHSMGGTIALLASFSNPLIQKVIPIMAPYDLRSRYIHSLTTPKGAQRKTAGVRTGIRDLPDPTQPVYQYSIPYSFVEEALTYEMIDSLRTCATPKCFITGTADESVDPQVVHDGYLLAGEPKEFHTISCSEHNYRLFPDAIQQVNEIIEKFLS